MRLENKVCLLMLVVTVEILFIYICITKSSYYVYKMWQGIDFQSLVLCGLLETYSGKVHSKFEFVQYVC